MRITDFQDLVCWRLSNELKLGVYALVDRTTAKRDFRFCHQITDAAASAPSNLSEAFGAYGHGQGARYARIAKSSLFETQNHLLDGIHRRHWSREEADVLILLSKRAIAATMGWIRYLETTDAPRAYWETD